MVDLTEDGKGDGANAVVRLAGFLATAGAVFPSHRHAILVLLKRDDLGVIGNEIPDLTLKPFGDAVHPTDGREHGGVVVAGLLCGEIFPQA